MKRIGKRVIEFDNSPSILSSAAVAGKKEAEGPMGQEFDKTFTDAYLGTESWEKAEAKLQNEAVNLALVKGGFKSEDMDMIFAGDLLNQCISSSFGNRDLNIPFLGQYGACSTMAQTLLMAAAMVDGGGAQRAVAVTSSHFCTAERQFRLPLEYGSQRSTTAQWTATASGAAIVGRGGNIRIVRGMPGKIVDLGIKDTANMGAAMAPAAADTVMGFFESTGTRPEDFDCIYTGDLGIVGSKLFHDLMRENGINIESVHRDCGCMMYSDNQDPHAGASGCGCSASILCSHIVRRLREGSVKRVLFCATGALMSVTSSQQGESIPGICHALELSVL